VIKIGFKRGNPGYSQHWPKSNAQSCIQIEANPITNDGITTLHKTVNSNARRYNNTNGKTQNFDISIFDDFHRWYAKYQQLPEQEQLMFAASTGLNATLIKHKETKIIDKQAERIEQSMWRYYDDVSLFKVQYCKKEYVKWQDDTLKWIHAQIANGVKVIIVVGPRRHGKTEGIAQPFLTHHITFHKNDACKYITLAQNLAIQKIGPIRDLLENHWPLIKDFGPFRTQIWAKDKFTITRSGYFPDPTLEALGQDSKFTGMNTDIDVIDDPMDADMSPDVKKGVHDRLLGELFNTHNPNCITLIIMTRKSNEDLVSCFTEDKCPFCTSNHKGSAAVKILPAIIEGDFRNPGPETYELERDAEGNIINVTIHGKYRVLWPERWPIETLIRKYYEIGESAFNREYQQEPAGEGLIFKEKWIQFHDVNDADFQSRDYRKYITVDLALSEKETADYSGIVGFGRNAFDNKFYVHKTFALHKPLHEVAQVINEYAAEFKPLSIIIEAIGAFAPLTENWPKVIKYPIEFITKKTVGKEERIAATLQPTLQNGQLLMKQSHQDLIYELKHFPTTSKDHLIDALQQGIQASLEHGSGVKYHSSIRKY